MFHRVILLAAVLVVSGSDALADTPAQARKAIEAIYENESVLLSKRDVDSVFTHQTPDYTAISKTGKRYSRNQANQMARQLTMAKTVAVVTRVVSFSLKGATATARIKSHVRATINDPQTGKMLAAIIDGVEDDTWVKQGGKWMLKQSREIERLQKVGGK